MAGDALTPRQRGRRWPYVLGVVLFLGYAAWMLGPYIRSVVVRDAAITTWSRLAASPIDGTVQYLPEYLTGSGRSGEDGVIAYVRNEHASREAVDEARFELERAIARVAELERHLLDIKELEEDRRDLKARYAETFRDQLDAKIDNLKNRIAIGESLLALMQQIAARKAELVSRGVGAQSEADEALLRVHQAAVELAGLQADLAYAEVSREAANNGVFSMDGGDDPAWAQDSRMELKLEKKEARLELRNAEADVAYRRERLASAESDLERLSTGTIVTPPGSLIWSEQVSSGMAVVEGEPVVEWLDCQSLLVDVPVSDVEAALIKIGQPATVVLEGERHPHEARVILVRGSAATLGRVDLVALAKGRTEGTAQVLLELFNESEEFDSCPVGQSAYVDFPDVGLLDVLRARLRL